MALWPQYDSQCSTDLSVVAAFQHVVSQKPASCKASVLVSPLPATESCPGRLVDIVGRAGLFLAGKVSPELQGVEISISERGAAAPLITVATDERGAYRYDGRDFSPSADGA